MAGAAGDVTNLGAGGRLGVAIGVAGAGKSTALAPLVEAWKADGREVFGITLAWRQAADLKSAGIAERASVAAFLKRVETERYVLGRNSVVVVDEVGLIGTRQMLDLVRLQQKTGMQIVMVGDPKQCQSIEAGPVIELLRRAIGDEAIPQILTSIRQKTEREREITSLFGAGRAVEALEMKQQDGTAELVAGGRQATVQRVARLWRERLGSPPRRSRVQIDRLSADQCRCARDRCRHPGRAAPGRRDRRGRQSLGRDRPQWGYLQAGVGGRRSRAPLRSGP